MRAGADEDSYVRDAIGDLVAVRAHLDRQHAVDDQYSHVVSIGASRH